MGPIRLRPLVVAAATVWILSLAAAFVVPTADRADFATRQTARVAVVFWGLAVGVLLAHGSRMVARWLWTLGVAAFVVHVATAFASIHGWSHSAAFDHVEIVSGFGPGIFISYAFSLLWIGDAVWWWLNRTSYDHRPTSVTSSLHAFMAFIIFNGTVVYETGAVRWVGAMMFAVLAGLVVRRKATPSPASSLFEPKSPLSGRRTASARPSGGSPTP